MEKEAGGRHGVEAVSRDGVCQGVEDGGEGVAGDGEQERGLEAGYEAGQSVL